MSESLRRVILETLDDHADTDGAFGEDCVCRWVRGDSTFDDHLADLLVPVITAWAEESADEYEHDHEWSRRGDVSDKWSQCWLCAEVRNGWDAPTRPATAPVSDPGASDVAQGGPAMNETPSACDSHRGICPTPAQLRQADMAKAWREGHAAGRDYQGDGWNSDAHDPEEDNPYRPGAKP